jgi:hypothetical protein
VSTSLDDHREHLVSHFVCALVDVLGQQEELRVLDADDDFYDLESAVAHDEFLKRLSRCRSVVENIRIVIHENINRWYPSIDDFELLSEEQRTKTLAEVKHRVSVSTFSDLVLAYGSVDSSSTRVPMVQIWSMACAVMFCQLAALANRCAVRGGIELGLGFEFGSNDLYGPVLSRVYSIESDVAKYPRVVIGSRLFRFVNHVAESGYAGEYTTLNQSMAQNLLRAFVIDPWDGEPILDFCGEAHHEWIKGREWESGKLYFDAMGFVHAEHLRLVEAKNDKLSHRYAALAGYMRFSQRVWERPAL